MHGILLSRKEYFIDLTKGYNNVLEEKREGNTLKYIWGNELIIAKDHQVSRYSFTDAINTPIRFFYYNGTISNMYDYDEFGNLQHGKWKDGQTYGFTGYRKEEIEGQYFSQARQYYATEGRFVNEDSFGGILVIGRIKDMGNRKK